MSALGEALGALAGVLDGAALDWYLFGAQAVAVRGAPRATQDLDVTVRAPRSELPALGAALSAAGFDPRFPEAADRLLAEGAVIPLAHRPTGFEVDLVVAGSGLEDLAMARATRILVEGVLVPVAHPTDLVVMNVPAGTGRATGRPIGRPSRAES